MSFSIGIVGLPNVGKSTLFQALTKKQVEAANYPFCTIEPNVGTVKVPDQRVNKLSEFSNSAKTIHTTVEFVDIAGLVKGAHKGEGLGNQFLGNIREVDAICEVVRQFKDSNVVHVDGKIDPVSDAETITMELIFKDQQTINKYLTTLEKSLKSGGDKKDFKVLDVVKKVKKDLDQMIPIRKMNFEPEEFLLIRPLNLLTAKPVIYILNTDETDLSSIEIPSGFENEVVIKVSAKLEAELADLPAEEIKEYLQTYNLDQTGLDKVIQESYKILDLLTFFTSGPKETRAWTIKQGAKAPQAAGKIHSDFEKGFIVAEIINWQELLDAGSEFQAKEKGLIRQEGKEYVMKDGDVVVFRFNV